MCCQGHLPFKTLMGSLRLCLLSLGVAWALRFSSVDSRSLERSLTTESPSDGEILPGKHAHTHTHTYMNNRSPRTHLHAEMPCIIENSVISTKVKAGGGEAGLLRNTNMILKIIVLNSVTIFTDRNINY